MAFTPNISDALEIARLSQIAVEAQTTADNDYFATMQTLCNSADASARNEKMFRKRETAAKELKSAETVASGLSTVPASLKQRLHNLKFNVTTLETKMMETFEACIATQVEYQEAVQTATDSADRALAAHMAVQERKKAAMEAAIKTPDASTKEELDMDSFRNLNYTRSFGPDSNYLTVENNFTSVEISVMHEQEVQGVTTLDLTQAKQLIEILQFIVKS